MKPGMFDCRFYYPSMLNELLDVYTTTTTTASLAHSFLSCHQFQHHHITLLYHHIILGTLQGGGLLSSSRKLNSIHDLQFEYRNTPSFITVMQISFQLDE